MFNFSLKPWRSSCGALKSRQPYRKIVRWKILYLGIALTEPQFFFHIYSARGWFQKTDKTIDKKGFEIIGRFKFGVFGGVIFRVRLAGSSSVM